MYIKAGFMTVRGQIYTYSIDPLDTW